MKLFVTGRDSMEHEFDVPEGITLMEAVRDNLGEEPFAICGGVCSCASCHVYVDPEFLDRLPEMEEDESDMLEGSGDRRLNSRLSCQIELTASLAGLRLTVAAEE